MSKLALRRKLSRRRLARSLPYIKNHPIKLPPTVSKITVVYHTQGFSQAGARHFIYEKFPSIAHHNPHITLKRIRVEQFNNRSFAIIEMADGSQHRMPFNRRTADDFTESLLLKTEEFDKKVDTQYAQFFKEWDEKLAL